MINNGARNLVFVCDGTLASQRPGEETNALLIHRLLQEVGAATRQEALYDRGIQHDGWQRWTAAITGQGINRSIRRGYGWLANRYRPGDRIYLFGYSRGAYAVRSLAGMIGRLGLLAPRHATERNVRLAFRHYQQEVETRASMVFSRRHCLQGVPIELLGVFDTVKALGLPYPLLTWLHPATTDFHYDGLGRHIRHGYHALAIDEDRMAYAPLLWSRSADWQGRLEQAWFPGAHADVGGEVRKLAAARPLSNIPLNWMLRRAAAAGLILPDDWRRRFPEDPAAPAVGNWRGHGKLFLFREPRRVGHGDGETLHLSIRDRQLALPRYHPRGLMTAEPEPASA